jgi:DNA-binding NarL/FixJ family response regulator
MNHPSTARVSTSVMDAETLCRVLIVDDHQLFRNGLAELINSDPEVTVVGEATDAQQALEKFEQLRPHLVTLDISLAKGNGLELIYKFKELDPSVAVLVVSMFDEGTYADPAIKAGATGYVCKQASNDQIMEAVRTVRRQGIYLSQPAMNRMLQRTVHSQTGKEIAPESQLSTRELQIFTLIGQGETTQKIAKQLFLAPSTVETYRERIKNKLNLASGAELTRRAILWTLHNS